MIIPSIYIYQTAERSYFPYSFSDIIEVQVLSLRGMSGSNHCPLNFACEIGQSVCLKIGYRVSTKSHG